VASAPLLPLLLLLLGRAFPVTAAAAAAASVDISDDTDDDARCNRFIITVSRCVAGRDGRA